MVAGVRIRDIVKTKYKNSFIYNLKSQKYTSFPAIDKRRSKLTFKIKFWVVSCDDL